MISPSRRRLLVAASCIMPLARCSVLPNPAASQIYRLSPRADDPVHGRIVRTRLVVEIPTASESLDTDRIALIRDQTRFDYFANSRWTDRVPLLVQALLIEAFENDGRIAEVGRDVQDLNPNYLLETDIRAFEARYSGAGDQPPVAVVAMDLGLVKMPDHRMLGRMLATESSPASRNGVDSIVEAFDVAIGRLLVRCIGWTTQMISHPA
jgi:cholesterol transport system auxiliary component